MIFYSKLQQMVGVIEKKRMKLMEFGFSRVHKKLRVWMKIDFFGKIVGNLEKKMWVNSKRFCFDKIMVFMNCC